MSAFTDAVAAQCLTEFARFNKGRGTETKDPFAGFVGEFWSFGLNNHSIDGRTTFQDERGRPFRPAWSAAFISFIMRKSGAGDAFFYSEAHIHYAVKAIRDAKVNPPTAKFLGRNPKTQVPKVGDLLTAGRGTSKNVTFADVLGKYGPKPVPKGNFMTTHSDIVIEVNAAKKTVTTIGGNVEDTVGQKTWTLKSDGTLVKGPSLICIVECLL